MRRSAWTSRHFFALPILVRSEESDMAFPRITKNLWEFSAASLSWKLSEFRTIPKCRWLTTKCLITAEFEEPDSTTWSRRIPNQSNYLPDKVWPDFDPAWRVRLPRLRLLGILLNPQMNWKKYIYRNPHSESSNHQVKQIYFNDSDHATLTSHICVAI